MTWIRNGLSVVLVVLLMLIIFMLVTASSADAAQIANAAVGFLVLVVAPLALKRVKLDGPTMVAVSYGATLVIAGVALYLSGQISFPPDPNNIAVLLAEATAIWGLQQALFQGLKDSPTIGPLLK